MATSSDFHDAHLELFVSDFSDGVRVRQNGGVEGDGVPALVPREDAVTGEFLERLCDGGDLPDLNQVYLPRQLVGNANAQVNAYAFSDVDRKLELVVTIARAGGGDCGELMSVPGADVVGAIRRALHVFKAAERPIYVGMEPASPSTDMFRTLHEIWMSVTGIRVVVLVEGVAKPFEFAQPEIGPRVKVDVWDLVRLQRVCMSGLPYDPVDIDLLSHVDEPLAFVAAGVEAPDHKCFLTILGGDLLHDLYDEYGSRLLELNVRSYLQARGKVNQGIRKTLIDDPGHFLAFNNGISATVEELGFDRRPDGSSGISRMRGLQIVNGGQTTASIHRAKSQDGVDLSFVRVQAKITVVDPQFLDTLVPNISRFSNTQNKVNETDFSANHPFHVQLQQLSQSVWVPGETSRWFYERARGQWEVARAREGTTLAKRAAFDVRTPKNQKVDKALLAKSENSWARKPDVVSRGGQKNFVDFMAGLTGELPDEGEYRRIIARVILFKSAERIARTIGFSAYRANAVTYTIALIAYRTLGRIDLEQIWRDQSTMAELNDVMASWMPLVHECIIENAQRENRNVTEWAKSRRCWAVIQGLHVSLPPIFEARLGAGLPRPNVGDFKDADAGTALTEEEMRRQASVMAMTADEYALIFRKLSRHAGDHGMIHGAWTAMTGCVTTLLMYAENGWSKIPTPKQTAQVVKAIEFLRRRDGDEAELE